MSSGGYGDVGGWVDGIGGAFVEFSKVDKILSQGGPLYLRNTSKHKGSGAASILVVSYPGAEGMRGFNFPRVSIPFNICNHIDPESLRGSDSFRKLIVNGTLEVVEPEQAKQELADPAKVAALRAAIREADEHGIYQVRQTEITANREAEQAIRQERLQAQSVGMQNLMAAADPRIAATLQAKINQGPQLPQPEGGGNPRFRALQARMGGMAPDAVVGELTLMYGDLTPNDLHSIVSDGRWPAEAQQWARQRIAYMTQAMNAQAEAAKLPEPSEEG